jgi:hypothetical protein
VWDKLRKQVAVELEQLKHLLEVHRSLLTKCITDTPDPIEVSALAAMLHSFYTGVENIFKRIAVSLRWCTAERRDVASSIVGRDDSAD